MWRFNFLSVLLYPVCRCWRTKRREAMVKWIRIHLRCNYSHHFKFHATICGQYMGSNMSTTLKCRSKEPDSLQCRYEDAKITKFSSNIFNVGAVVPFKDATYQEFDFGNETFELELYDRGIKEYLFEEKMDNYNVRIRSVQKVEKLENSSMGECFVCYKHSRKKVDDRTNKGEFQFIWLADQTMDPEITKKVYLNDCVLRPIYKFEIRRMYSVALLLSKKKLVRDDFILYRQNMMYLSYNITTEVQFYKTNIHFFLEECLYSKRNVNCKFLQSEFFFFFFFFLEETLEHFILTLCVVFWFYFGFFLKFRIVKKLDVNINEGRFIIK